MGKTGTNTRRAAAEISAPVRSLCRRLLLSLAGSVVLVALIGIAADQAGVDRRWLALLAVLAAAPVWAVCAFFQAGPRPEPVLPLGADERPLRELCDDLARTMSLSPVRRLALSRQAHPRLHTDAGGVSLHLGGPGLWHLHESELRALLAPLIASSSVATHAKMRWASRLGGRMLRAYDGAPLAVGWLVRGLTKELSRALQAMDRDLVEWGRARTADHGPSGDLEVDVLAEAWEVFLDGFARPSYQRSWVPVELGRGLHEFMAALDVCGVIDRRKARRVQGRRVVDLLGDPAELDGRFSRLVAQGMGADGPDLSWSRYPEEVVGPHERELAAKLVSAVGLVRGEAVAATMSTVLEAVEEDKQQIAAALHGDRSDDMDQASADAAMKVLEQHLVGFVTTAIVDAGRATRELDWLAGHVVLTDEREVMDVAGVVASFLHDSNPRLYAWMEWLALLPATVQLDGRDAQSAVFASGVCGPVLWQGVVADLVRHGDELIVLGAPRSFRWRRLVDALAGRRWVVERLRHNRTTPIEQLLRELPASVRMPASEIVGAQLITRRFTRLWKCVLELPGQRVVLRGNVDARTVVRALRAELGERVSTPRAVSGDAPAPGRHARRDPRSGPARIRRPWASGRFESSRDVGGRVGLGEPVGDGIEDPADRTEVGGARQVDQVGTHPGDMRGGGLLQSGETGVGEDRLHAASVSGAGHALDERGPLQPRHGVGDPAA